MAFLARFIGIVWLTTGTLLEYVNDEHLINATTVGVGVLWMILAELVEVRTKGRLR